MAKPQQAHFDIGILTLQYIKGTLSHGLLYKRGHPINLQGFTDATWGSCTDTFKSTGAYLFTTGGAAVSWSTKPQQMVSLSSTESEYKALTMGGQEAVWLRQLLQELNPTNLPPVWLHCKDMQITSILAQEEKSRESNNKLTVIHCDNQSALKMANNPVFHARTKDIAIQHHFIREKVAQQEITVRYISTQLQPADMLTKALSKTKFQQHREALGLHDGAPPR
jgi:hypothetical protein